MNKLIFTKEIPDFVLEFAKTKEMQRLKDISMSCGMDRTSYKLYQMHKANKFDHSLNAALVVWNFTHDINQSLSALLHDIATPVFAHVIDFLNGDYVKQESTEEKTLEIILNSKEIKRLLKKYGISVNDVYDYHRYPIADNDSPKLSSDRLEYSLTNFIEFSLASLEDTQDIYNDIAVGMNEFGKEELCFNTMYFAKLFQELSLKCSKIYSSDFCRGSMEYLSSIIRTLLEDKSVTYDDLFSIQEKDIMKMLSSNEHTKGLWKDFCSFSKVTALRDDDEWSEQKNIKKVMAKLRYIDPYVLEYGYRVSDLCKSARKDIMNYKTQDFNYFIKVE